VLVETAQRSFLDCRVIFSSPAARFQQLYRRSIAVLALAATNPVAFYRFVADGFGAHCDFLPRPAG
jgi:hypothetical protein